MGSLVEIPQPSRFRIGDLFNDNNFVVPVYQRNYAWGKSEVNDFWEDLKDLVYGKRNSHFFGQIVTYQDKNGLQEIIDGQQRLTTSIIFLAVVRDVADKLYKDNFVKSQGDVNLESGDTLRDIHLQVQRSLRGSFDEEPSLIVQQVPNLDGVCELQNYFFRLTSGSKSEIPTNQLTEPMKNMQIAYKAMMMWIEKAIEKKITLGEQIDLLRQIFSSFYRKFYLVMISAPGRQDAFTIFETLNSRGKDLKASDIIKNHLMSMMGDKTADANQSWNAITSKLNNDSKRITRFIRTYWASKERIVSEAKLYREVSGGITDINTARTFLTDLSELVELYTVFEFPGENKELSVFKNSAIMQHLDVLSRMRILLYYPVIMAMYYRKYSEKDILKVVNKLLSIYIRHRTIINDGTNKLETGFSDIAKNIWNINYKSVDIIVNNLDEKMLKTNATTKAGFSVLSKDGGQRGAKKWTLLYLLSEIYNMHFENFDEDEWYCRVFTEDNYRLINVSSSKDIGEYKKYVGNWTIIEKKLVKKELSSLAEVTDQLEKSGLRANNELASRIRRHGWTVNEIKRRQELFSEDVVTIW